MEYYFVFYFFKARKHIDKREYLCILHCFTCDVFDSFIFEIYCAIHIIAKVTFDFCWNKSYRFNIQVLVAVCHVYIHARNINCQK